MLLLIYDETVLVDDMQILFEVTMKDRAGAEHACRDPNPIIDGRKANVNLAYLGAKPRNNAQFGKYNYNYKACFSEPNSV